MCKCVIGALGILSLLKHKVLVFCKKKYIYIFLVFSVENDSLSEGGEHVPSQLPRDKNKTHTLMSQFS